MKKNIVKIYGWGQEFIIGSLSEDQVNIIRDENNDINEIFQYETEGIDDVLHLYGPEMSEVSFVDKNEEIISLPNIVINYEPCWETVDKSLLIQSLQEQCDDFFNANEIAETLLASQIFNNRSNSESYLIQRHAEIGCWGEFVLPADKNFNNIYSLSVEMEGMELYANMLVGFLVKENIGYSLGNFILNGSTEVKSKEYYVFIKHKGIVWEI